MTRPSQTTNANNTPPQSPITDISLPAMRALYELNVFSPIRTIQVFLPLLLLSPSSGSSTVTTLPPPVIIHHTSAASLTPVGCTPFQSAYNSSKAAASSLASSLRLELAPLGVRVVELLTGSVRTNFFTNMESSAAEGGSIKLKEGSLYEPAREEVESVMRGGVLVEGAMDKGVWARRVVRDLEGGRELVYRGKMASTAKWVHGLQALVPTWVLNWFLRDLGRIGVVEKRVRDVRAAEARERKVL